MKIGLLVIIAVAVSSCYTTLHHPGPVRAQSVSAAEACGACHSGSAEYAYYRDEEHLIPIVSSEESDAVEEFVELTRTRRASGDVPVYNPPVYPQVVGFIQSVGQQTVVTSQEPQSEKAEVGSSAERRSYGLRTSTKKEKERKFQ